MNPTMANQKSPVVKATVPIPRTGSRPMATRIDPPEPRPMATRLRPSLLVESGELPGRFVEELGAAASVGGLASCVLLAVYLGIR